MRRLWVFFVALSLQSLTAAAPVHGWKVYKNDRRGFCVEYPASWKWGQGVNHAGIFAYPPEYEKPGPSDAVSGIEVGAQPNQPTDDDKRMQTLDEVFMGTADVLGKITDTRLVDKEQRTFQGVPAIFATISYRRNGEDWIARSIRFISAEQWVYLLEMRCRASQRAEFERIFDHMVASFKMHCVRVR